MLYIHVKLPVYLIMSKFWSYLIISMCIPYASSSICPVDGPDYNATEIGHGQYPLSNNALQSCYTEDYDILP